MGGSEVLVVIKERLEPCVRSTTKESEINMSMMTS